MLEIQAIYEPIIRFREARALEVPLVNSEIWQWLETEVYRNIPEFQVAALWDLFIDFLDSKRAKNFRREILSIFVEAAFVDAGKGQLRLSPNKIHQAKTGFRAAIYHEVIRFFFDSNNKNQVFDATVVLQFLESPLNFDQEVNRATGSYPELTGAIAVMTLAYVAMLMLGEQDFNTLTTAAHLTILLKQALVGSGVGLVAGTAVGGLLTRSRRDGLKAGFNTALVGSGAGIAYGLTAEGTTSLLEKFSNTSGEILVVLAVLSLVNGLLVARRQRQADSRSEITPDFIHNINTQCAKEKTDLILQTLAIAVLKQLQQFEQQRVDSTEGSIPTEIDSQTEIGYKPTQAPIAPGPKGTRQIIGRIHFAEATAWQERDNQAKKGDVITAVLPSIDSLHTLSNQQKQKLAQIVFNLYVYLKEHPGSLKGRELVQLAFLPTAMSLTTTNLVKGDDVRSNQYWQTKGHRGDLLGTFGEAAPLAKRWYSELSANARESHLQLRAQAWLELLESYELVLSSGKREAIFALPPAIKKAILEGICLSGDATGHMLEAFLESAANPYDQVVQGDQTKVRIADVALIELFLAETAISVENPYGATQQDLEETATAVRVFRQKFIEKVLETCLPTDKENLKQLLQSDVLASKCILILRILMESVENEVELKLITDKLKTINSSIDDHAGIARKTGELYEQSLFSSAFVDILSFIKKRDRFQESALVRDGYRHLVFFLDTISLSVANDLLHGCDFSCKFQLDDARVNLTLSTIPSCMMLLPLSQQASLIGSLSDILKCLPENLNQVIVTSASGNKGMDASPDLARINLVMKLTQKILTMKRNILVADPELNNEPLVRLNNSLTELRQEYDIATTALEATARRLQTYPNVHYLN